jgi:hypothetical protein
MSGRHRSHRPPFGKEAKSVRRHQHRQTRQAVKRAVRRDEDPPRVRKTEGWQTW